MLQCHIGIPLVALTTRTSQTCLGRFSCVLQSSERDAIRGAIIVVNREVGHFLAPRRDLKRFRHESKRAFRMTVREFELTKIAKYVRRGKFVADLSARGNGLDVVSPSGREVALRICTHAEKTEARRDADLVPPLAKRGDSTLDDAMRFIGAPGLEQAIREHAERVGHAAHIADALVEFEGPLGAGSHRFALHKSRARAPEPGRDGRLAFFIDGFEAERDPSPRLTRKSAEKPKPL